MKLMQFFEQGVVCLGVKTAKGLLDIKKASEKLNETVPNDLQELISQGDEGLVAFENFIKKVEAKDDSSMYLDEETITYAPAVSRPEKILCVGLNYINHAKESKMDIPESPILFNKFNNSLAAHNEKVNIPGTTKQMDFEAELVVVIGKKAKNVSKEEALSYVFGYSVGNDLSARDLQFKNGQWLLGKALDGFAPVGPYVTTRDEIDPNNLHIECKVNGEIRQSANTKDMIFDCATLVSYISQHMTLVPGDIIFTGTPDGVILGLPEDDQVWLASGDEIQAKVENLGTLTTTLK